MGGYAVDPDAALAGRRIVVDPGDEVPADAALSFDEWSSREHSTNALIMRSRYRQPFGTFSGTLPGGIELAAGYGVMEDHDVHW